MHLSSTDPYLSPRKRGSTHKSMFMRQLSSLLPDEVVLPGVGKTDEFGSKDVSDERPGSIGNILNSPLKGIVNKAAANVAHKMRPTGRLKNAAKKVAAVNELSNKLKDIEDRKAVHGDVLPPPRCLNKYLKNAQQEEKHMTRMDEDQKK